MTNDCYVGIDYSLTSPAICVSKGEGFQPSFFYFLTDKKKCTGQFGNIIGHLHSEYTSPQQRYDSIARFFLKYIPKNAKVMIEDYSFGSTGKVFHIAENCGHLKYLLWEAGIEYNTVPPTVIKKFATGKGNANKEKMYESFFTEVGVDLNSVLGSGTKISSPVSDVVDAYYIACYSKEFYSLSKTVLS